MLLKVLTEFSENNLFCLIYPSNLNALYNAIKKAIDDAPESVLADILDYLKQIKVTPEKKIDLTRHLGQILREDKELLQRLAL